VTRRFSPHAERPWGPRAKLAALESTLRDRQAILHCAGEGRSTAEIAADLHLSEGTVRNYLSEAIAKLGATNRIDAAGIARARGWL
jgi:two-component system, NarL family, response regulator DesR